MKISIVHKLSVTSVALVLISIAVVSGVFYSKTSDLLVNETLYDISKDIQIAGQRLSSNIDAQSEDILFLANTPPIQGILRARKSNNYDKQGNSTYQQWVLRLQSIFRTMLRAKPSYLKLRLIDKNGQERIVVGRDGDQISTLVNEQLQNKKHRTYMKNALKLKEGGIYLSEINLNKEFGKVSKPHIEVMRSTTPIYDEQTGTLEAVLLLTVDVGHQLHSIREEVAREEREIYITNDRGGYLLHPDKNKTYGFDLGKKYRIQEDFPWLANLYLPDNQDKDVILLPQNVGGENVINFKKVFFGYKNSKRFIAVGVTQPYKAILNVQQGLLNDVVLTAIVLAFFVALMAIFLAYRLALPIKNITQVMSDYSKGRKSDINLPQNQSDEIGILARNYASLVAQVDEAKANLEESNRTLENRVQERTEALESSEIAQRAIVENMVDGLITINKVGTVESFNPAAVMIFGFKPDEVIGKNIKMLMPDPYHSEHDGYLDNYHQSGTKKIIGIGRDVEGLRKDGSTFPMELAVSEMMVQGEKLFTGIVRDITERKQMDKMKNEFISTVSHELRTPLTAIRGSLGLLTSGTVGELPDSANEMLTVASNNTARLLLLINDILDIQKIESGKMNFNFNIVNVNSFLKQAITDHAEYGTQHGVTFVLETTLDDAQVFADKDRLMQVMGNLLSNAAKFSPNGENVDISVARHESNHLRISVTDYGEGISDEFQPKLFERFTQSDSSDTRAKGGTGLGLSITKVITEKHGGRIGFVSKEGIGSTFYIELPELVDGVDTTKSAIMPLDVEHKACVLIVEDDPDVAALIRRMLAEAGFNSDIAYDAGQARQLLMERKNYYRLMTLDIILPGEDGISFLTNLRKEAETQRLPVVVLSVKADEAKRELEGGALDVADWLSKPIDSKRLVDVVSNVVADNEPPRVLHVEDEKDVHVVVNQMLKGHCELLWTTTVAESREMIKKNNIDLVLLDIGLPDGSGLDLIEDIEQLSPQPQVVIFSALDVSDEYADRVDAVLVKSKTNNKKLLSVLLGAMK